MYLVYSVTYAGVFLVSICGAVIAVHIHVLKQDVIAAKYLTRFIRSFNRSTVPTTHPFT